MKAVRLLLPALMFVGIASAQVRSQGNSNDAPTVTVTRISWRQEVLVPALYDDPMQINQDQKELVRDQKATARENNDRVRQGQNPIPPPTKKVASNVPVGSTPMGVPIGDEPVGNKNLPDKEEPGLSSIYYVYEAKVMNTGEKTIKAIVWVYSLVDPEAKIEVGRRVFKNIVSIRAGKTANLIRRSRNPPASVVNVSKAGKEVRNKYAEKVIIERVEYDDGSVWQRASN